METIEEIVAEEARERIRADIRKKGLLQMEKMYEDLVKETEVKTFKRNIYCSDCGEAFKWTGITLTSNPPWFPHTCPQCKYEVNFREIFPNTVYKEVK